MKFSCFLVLTLGLAVLLGASSSASGSTTLGPTATLSNDVVHYLSAATLLGAMPATQQVTVGVMPNNPNQAAEDTYLAQLYDPSSTAAIRRSASARSRGSTAAAATASSSPPAATSRASRR